MLRRMPASQLLDWMIFEELEPFGDERAEVGVAHLLRELDLMTRLQLAKPGARVHRKPLKDFVLRVGDLMPPAAARTQSPKEQMSLMRAIAAAYVPGVRAADD